MSELIHAAAVIDPGARLADGVRVGPHAVIGADVEIAAETEIGAGAHVVGPTRMGRGNRIFPHACIGFEPQDLKFGGEYVRLEIGDRNVFREFCTVHRGTGGGGGLTTVGSDNLFMVYTHIAHDCHVGDRTVFANNATLAGHVDVEDDAVVGAFTAVHQFGRVGCHAWVGAYTQISMDALPYAKTAGSKAACYGPNRIGLERKGISPEAIAALERAFKLLARSGLNTQQAVAAIEEEHGTVAEVRTLVEFIAGSRRGIHKRSPRQVAARGADPA